MDGLTCSLCGNKYSRRDVLRRHLEQVHAQKRPYKCFHCDYHGHEKASVKNHCIRVHEMTEFEFNIKAEREYEGLGKKKGRPRGSGGKKSMEFDHE